MSFTLEAGNLAVIVGTNGCGKSTILKLLTRLYNPDSGTILIDGEDIRKYSMADLRQAMATLTQDHRLFPVSISENIGLGFSDKVNDEKMIRDAAEKGGAIQLIEKLDQKMETVLEPKTIQYGIHVSVGDGTLLGKEFHTLRKSANVSGSKLLSSPFQYVSYYHISRRGTSKTCSVSFPSLLTTCGLTFCSAQIADFYALELRQSPACSC